MFSTARNVTVADIHTDCDIPHGTINTSMGACRPRGYKKLHGIGKNG